MENKIDVAPCKGVKAKLGPYDVTFYFGMGTMRKLSEKYGTPQDALDIFKVFLDGKLTVESIDTLTELYVFALEEYNPDITEEKILKLDFNDYSNAITHMLEAFYDAMGVRIGDIEQQPEDKNPPKA